MEKYLQIPIEEILLKYQSTIGAEKEFLNLLLVQGKNNITTVIIAILNTVKLGYSGYNEQKIIVFWFDPTYLRPGVLKLGVATLLRVAKVY